MNLPEGAPDWVVALWVVCGALSGVAGAWFTSRATRAHRREQDAKVDEVHRQVVNNHPDDSNMREELDEVREMQRGAARAEDLEEIRELLRGLARAEDLDDVRRDVRGLRLDVGGLRGDDRAVSQRVTRLERLAMRVHPGEEL